MRYRTSSEIQVLHQQGRTLLSVKHVVADVNASTPLIRNSFDTYQYKVTDATRMLTKRLTVGQRESQATCPACPFLPTRPLPVPWFIVQNSSMPTLWIEQLACAIFMFARAIRAPSNVMSKRVRDCNFCTILSVEHGQVGRSRHRLPTGYCLCERPPQSRRTPASKRPLVIDAITSGACLLIALSALSRDVSG